MSVYVRDIRRVLAALIRRLELPGVDPKHVYTNRTRPYDVERMPAVCVFTLSEEAKAELEESPRINQCEAEIAVAVYVKTLAREDTDDDDLLDDYLQAIRELVMVQDTFEDNAESSSYAGCEWIFANEGEFPMAAGILRFRVRYREAVPEAAGGNLANLRRIHTEWDGAPAPDGQVDAVDEVEFP